MSKTVTALQRVGIAARDYSRPPTGMSRETFTAAIAGANSGTFGSAGAIFIHEGTAEIDFHGSKPHRQAVLNVAEGDRTLRQRDVNVRIYFRGDVDAWKDPPRPTVSQFRQRFRVVVAPGTKFEIEDLRWERMPKEGDRWVDWWATVIAHSPGGSQSLLMGMDETANFIALLPEEADSVDQAHRLLRPPEVRFKQGVKRQGEWFFIPVPVRDLPQVGNLASVSRIHYDEALDLTTHRASEVLRIGGGGPWDVPIVRFARGQVTDRREGHHKPLQLGPRWHRVVRNRERLDVPIRVGMQVQRYD